jgi:hypothetical protein
VCSGVAGEQGGRLVFCACFPQGKHVERRGECPRFSLSAALIVPMVSDDEAA